MLFGVCGMFHSVLRDVSGLCLYDVAVVRASDFVCKACPWPCRSSCLIRTPMNAEQCRAESGPHEELQAPVTMRNRKDLGSLGWMTSLQGLAGGPSQDPDSHIFLPSRSVAESGQGKVGIQPLFLWPAGALGTHRDGEADCRPTMAISTPLTLPQGMTYSRM